MTVRWILFGAHHCDAQSPCAVEKPFHATLEPVRCRNLTVEGVAFLVVVLVTVGPTAKDVAQKHIADASDFERTLQRAAIELRGEPAVRRGPHVRNHVNVRNAEELQQLRPRVV